MTRAEHAHWSELKGGSVAWTFSNPAVATVVSASDKASATSVSVVARVGINATIQALISGAADITVARRRSSDSLQLRR